MPDITSNVPSVNSNSVTPSMSSVNSNFVSPSSTLWHKRLDHASEQVVKVVLHSCNLSHGNKICFQRVKLIV